MTNSPALLALDIDGTLVSYDDILSARARAGVQAVAASGTHVVLATGRSLLATLPVARELGMPDGYAVCSNGAVTVRLDSSGPDGYEVIDMRTFDPAPAVALLREQLPTAVYAVEEVGRGYRMTAPFPPGEVTGPQQVVSVDDLLAEPATRVIVRSPDHTPEQFIDLVATLGLQGVNYAVGWTAWLDLAPEGVSKASGLETVRGLLDVPCVDTMAVGDGRNDVEMVAWAARGVAMGHAPGELKAVADEVCGDIDHDGVAALLESLTADD